MNTVLVERSTGIGDSQHRTVEINPQRTRNPGPKRRVGSVLRQLCEQPVAVTRCSQIRFGGGVLAQARRRFRPRTQRGVAERAGPERIPYSVDTEPESSVPAADVLDISTAPSS